LCIKTKVANKNCTDQIQQNTIQGVTLSPLQTQILLDKGENFLNKQFLTFLSEIR